MTTRRHISTTERVQIFEAAGGICHICQQPIQVGEKWDAEHVIPLAMGGEDRIPNIKPAHDVCHDPKTKQDIADIARAKRVSANHIGAKAPPRNPIRSAGFPKKERRERPSLEPRALYEEIVK